MPKQPPPPPPSAAKILCSEGEFHIAEMSDGGVNAHWRNWKYEADDVESLAAAGVLNAHELFLLKYGIGGK